MKWKGSIEPPEKATLKRPSFIRFKDLKSAIIEGDIFYHAVFNSQYWFTDNISIVTVIVLLIGKPIFHFV